MTAIFNKLISNFVRRDNHEIDSPVEVNHYWDASYFLLDKVHCYQQLSSDNQKLILKKSSDILLSESLIIEQFGIEYSAKLALMSQTKEEKQLYALMGADEATHFYWLSQFVTDELELDDKQPFVKLLSELVSSNDRYPMIYLLQIVLEGWGLMHYQQLKQQCRHVQLTNIFQEILKDEALHHTTGKEVFSAKHLNQQQKQFITDALSEMLMMIRVGPQRVLSTLDSVSEGLSRNDILESLNQMDFQFTEQKKLDTIRNIINQSELPDIISKLDEKDCFQVFSSEQCTDVFLSSR